MDVGHPSELRILWPELEPESPDQPLDQETVAIAERRAKVFRLYTRGKSIRMIAEDASLRCSKSTVARDVQHVLQSYQKIVMQDARAHVIREVAKLTEMEAEAWDAWEKSRGEHIERNEEERDGKPGLRKTKRRLREGDPRYFKLALMCCDRRCRLVGILKAEDFKKDAGLPPVKLVAGIDPAEVV